MELKVEFKGVNPNDPEFAADRKRVEKIADYSAMETVDIEGGHILSGETERRFAPVYKAVHNEFGGRCHTSALGPAGDSNRAIITLDYTR